MLRHTWTCACCGEQHTDLPLDYGCRAPDPWLALPEGRRNDAGNKLSASFCIINDRDFFVRGCIEIPIAACGETFMWGVWVSLSEANFRRIWALWDADVSNEPPMVGWLCNTIPYYPPTAALKARITLRNGGRRPAITLDPGDHPLAVDQRQGITMARVEEIASVLLAHA